MNLPLHGEVKKRDVKVLYKIANKKGDQPGQECLKNKDDSIKLKIIKKLEEFAHCRVTPLN